MTENQTVNATSSLLLTSGGTHYLAKALEIFSDLNVRFQMPQSLGDDFFEHGMHLLDPIVHPSPIPAAFNQAGLFEIGQMTGDFWLFGLKHFLQMADADLT